MPDITAALAQIAAARTLLDDATATLTAPPPAPDPQPIFQYAEQITQPIELEAAPDLTLPAARVAFSFTCDVIGGTQGLFSRDASGLAPAGGHVSIWLSGDLLKVRMQDATASEEKLVKAITAGVTYAVELVFGPQGWALSVDEVQMCAGDLAVSWESTQNHIQFGALGWASAEGAPGWVAALNGTMSELLIDAMALDEPAPDPAPEPDPAPNPTPDPEPQPAPDATAANRDALLAALSAAAGGETIALAAGDYGDLSLIGYSFAAPVMLAAAPGARASTLLVQDCEGVKLAGLHLDNPGNGATGQPLAHVKNCKRCALQSCEINASVDGIPGGFTGLIVEGGDAIEVIGNRFHDLRRCGIFIGVTNLTVSENVCEEIGDDSFKFIGVHGVLIENNTGARNVYPSAGAHLDFIQFQGGDSSNIVVRGNVQLPGNAGAADMQGIYFDDAHYSNVLVEQNILMTALIRGISVSSGSNFVARHNTVLDIDGRGSKATLIMGATESYGNIVSTYATDGRQGVGGDGDLWLQMTNPAGAWHYDKFFANAAHGLGTTLADLAPVAGSLADGPYGAHARLMELLAADA